MPQWLAFVHKEKEDPAKDSPEVAVPGEEFNQHEFANGGKSGTSKDAEAELVSEKVPEPSTEGE